MMRVSAGRRRYENASTVRVSQFWVTCRATRMESSAKTSRSTRATLDVRGTSIVADKLIVSLLPGATEMVAAIGGVSQLVGVSHACDWPPAIESLPRVTITPIDATRSSLEIHRAVQAAAGAGQSVIGIDAEVLRTLRPDVIITQELCDVCAVADGEAIALARAMT